MGNLGSKRKGPAIPEEFTKPNGLYPKCEWEDKAVRKLILARKLAPRYPPDGDGRSDLEECPICFLFYPGGLNRSNCCKKPICTECYLQIKKPTSSHASCPFCNKSKYSVVYVGPKTDEERVREQLEEQRVAELQLKMRQEEIAEDTRRMEERSRSGSLEPTPEELRQVHAREHQQAILHQQGQTYLAQQQQIAPPGHSPVLSSNSSSPMPPSGRRESHDRGERVHRRHRRHRSHHSSHSRQSHHSQHSQHSQEQRQMRLQQILGMQPGMIIPPNMQASSWGGLLTRLAMDPTMRHNLVEIEQLMLMEAMRLSLQQPATADDDAAPASPLAVVGVPIAGIPPNSADVVDAVAAAPVPELAVTEAVPVVDDLATNTDVAVDVDASGSAAEVADPMVPILEVVTVPEPVSSPADIIASPTSADSMMEAPTSPLAVHTATIASTTPLSAHGPTLNSSDIDAPVSAVEEPMEAIPFQL
eukprot:TRINITY_DN5058_c0_g1_i1.p1 TRINITY_DN5058_c0_g1~~TRINITY_DN5058_c0_g1_i1.p1  ORF type:complete len:474 (-),score=106.17 TRINITY_DN5058_c0_g1_i1:156-1577(-)